MRDPVGDEGVTGFVEGRADTGEHSGAGGSELGFGDLKGQLLHLGLADVAGLVPDHEWFGGLGREVRFNKSCFVHADYYSTPQKNVKFDVSLAESTMYWRMHQFQRNRIVLLTELHALVSDNLSREHEFVTRDIKRYNRKLKAMRNTLKEWIGQLVTEEKLREQERRHDEELRKQAEAAMAARANADQ
jgi:hypothetical protein